MNPPKIFLLTFFCFIALVNSAAPYNYKAFNGNTYTLDAWVGEKVVLLLPLNFNGDTATISEILHLSDGFYKFYQNNLGYEPPGGNPDFNSKTTIAFVPSTCPGGAGCGWVGAKGVEIGDGLWGPIYNSVLYHTNVSRIVTIPYELGRNFFQFSSKILFPDTQYNGGFAEAFANTMYLAAMDAVVTNPDMRRNNETFAYKASLYQIGLGYINDPNADAKKYLGDGIGPLLPSYAASALISLVNETYKQYNVFGFWKLLLNEPDTKTYQDALDNLAIAISKQTNLNLTNFFNYDLKFNLSQNAIGVLSVLPEAPKKLIRDEQERTFINERDSVHMQVRATDYDSTTYSFEIVSPNGKILLQSNKGNYLFKPDIFDQACGNDIFLTVRLKVSSLPVDSFFFELKYRKDFNFVKEDKDFLKFYLYSSSGVGYSTFNPNDSSYCLHNATDGYENLLLQFGFASFYKRVYQFTAEARLGNISPANGTFNGFWAYLEYGNGRGQWGSDQRLGIDIVTTDTTQWIPLKIVFSTDYFGFTGDSVEGRIFRFGVAGNGPYKVYFRNIRFSDLTWNDTLTKAIILTPAVDTIGKTRFCFGDSVILKSSAESGNQWYKNDTAINGATGATLKVATSGSYSVKVFKNECSSLSSKAVIIDAISVPTPSITFNGSQLVSNAAIGNQWYLNGVMISAATGQNYVPSTSGSYTVQVTVNDCASQFSNTYDFIITGLPQIALDSNIKVIPNPVKNKVIIVQKGHKSILNLRLFDISGNEVTTLSSNSENIEIDMSKYSSGSYILWIEDRRTNSFSTKIIVKL